MAEFPENIKKKAKKKAHYKCCVCEQPIPVHIHHIKQPNQGGSNDFDNAIALCPNCHGIYGHNPTFEKWLREKRDSWYDRCARESAMMDKLEEMHNILMDPVSGYIVKMNRLELLMDSLVSVSGVIMSGMKSASPSEKQQFVADIATASGTLNIVSNAVTHISDYIFAQCPNCKLNVFITKSNEFQVCPNCNRVLKDDRGTYYIDIYP